MTIIRLIGILFLLIPVIACAGAAAPKRPNILLIVAEDMSPRVGAYGDPVAQTPTLDKLASEGVRYTHVFTASGVCAPSRAALITGVHQISLGAQHMRTSNYHYQAVPPPEVKAFPELLRAAGYLTANVAKTDYQFGDPFTIWDVNAGSMAEPPDLAVWRRLPQGQPFFAMVNLMSTHESRLVTPDTSEEGRFGGMVKRFKQSIAQVKRVTDPDDVEVPPYYPDTPAVRQSIARLYDNIHFMDGEVKQILANLEADGLAGNTIVIWTTDHGDGLPRAKRSVYDSGLEVPMIIRYPDGHGKGSVRQRMVSFVDLAPTILTLAGAEVPGFIQGRDFLGGPQRGYSSEHSYIHASRDRMDEIPDRVRAVRDQRFKYIRNYLPAVPYFRPLAFPDLFPVMRELWRGHEAGSLSPEQAFYFTAPRPGEELYDTQNDPHEINNLAGDPQYKAVLERLSKQMDQWLARVGDRSEGPEEAMIKDMWPGGEQPITAAPKARLEQVEDSYIVTLSSETEGASMGYRILKGMDATGWKLYTGPIRLQKDNKLEAKAIRYGYKESKVTLLAPDTPQAPAQATITQAIIESRVKPVITEDGLQFRDLNGDGSLTPYEDWRLSPAERAEDLVARMTVAEKAGAMMHSTLPGMNGASGRSEEGYDLEQVASLLSKKHVTSYISRLSLDAETLAGQNNAVQALAEQTRLGIPVSISTDPRHHFQYVLGASTEGGGFSQWPEQLGFAALNDRELMRTFGDIARREYRAVGLHIALSPQADLATEPRWPRMTATFGSRAELASDMAGAYVAGFQGGDDGLTAEGVMTVVKHWVGYGAAIDGYDGHNYYGRYAQLSGDSLQPHIDAFIGAFAARSGGVMPTYPVLKGATVNGEPAEQVGAGFSKQLLTDLLRGQYNYQGIILSDWAITRDCNAECMNPTQPHTVAAIAMPWGVESLSPYQRFVKGVNAGLDQFGGTDDAYHLVEAVGKGDLSEQRLDQSVRRVLMAKFQQGLFEDPYVDPVQAARIVGADEFVARAGQVQREAQVLLENRDGLLPVAAAMRRVYLFGMAPAAARQAGLTVVEDPAEADFALIRAGAPHENLHPKHFFGRRQHEGRLDYRDGDPAYEALKKASAQVPTVFAIFLDRPAILTNVRDKAQAILANFGASDAAVLDVVLGRASARGRLPFELPSSMAAVAAQHPAVGDDSKDPLYPFGAGILPGN